jgi:hypothetical protein
VTAPLALPPSCVLWVDGARYADGQPTEADTAPVALTGLTVTWGRATTIDQPAPASCAFTVLDRPGGVRAAETIGIGSRVQVRADAVIYPDPTVPTVTDPGFEAAAAGSVVATISSNARPVLVTTGTAHTGAHAARIDPVDASRGVRVIFPPAPFTPGDPAGWDAVPRTLPGQTWAYGAALHTATGGRALLHPVTFTQPWPGTETVLTTVADAGAPDAAGWAVDTGRVTPPPGVWLGLAVEIHPAGPAWVDLPPNMPWANIPAAQTWQDLAVTFVDDLVVLAPASGAARAGEVFTGRVTDLVAQWDDAAGGTVLEVTAQDDTAELANRYVGAQPWAAETLAARFGRILAAAGQQLNFTVDPVPGARLVTYRDVDNQSALGLVQSLAQSAGAALWSATSLTTGPYLRLEDIDARPALFTLAKDPGGVIRIVPAAMPGGHGITLSACDVLLDPVRWEQDIGDVATRVAIGWKDQTPDPVKPVDATVTVVDTAGELTRGQRRVQISTELATLTDAQQVANSVLGRLSVGGWRISGLTYRVAANAPLDAAAIGLVMTILDATTRIGLPILLTDVPSWSPTGTAATVPLYLEGARLANQDGAWQLDLVTSSAHAAGAALARWVDLPADWFWNQFDPAIRWADLAGVGPPT